MADQVRYMVYRVTMEDCKRPDLGWDSWRRGKKIGLIKFDAHQKLVCIL